VYVERATETVGRLITFHHLSSAGIHCFSALCECAHWFKQTSTKFS